MSTLLPPRPSINLVDANGKMTRPWTIYFDDVFRRLGGSVAPDLGELEAMISQLPDTSAAIESRIAIAESYASQLPQAQPEARQESAADGQLQALQAEVAALRGIVEGLLQGYQV